MRHFVWFPFLVVACVSESTRPSTLLNPCNDFYDYVCSKDTRVIANFTFTRNDEYVEVKTPEDNSTFLNNITTVPLDKLVKLTTVMKWCTEVEVLYTGILTKDYFGDLDSKIKMNHTKRYSAVQKRLSQLNSTMVNVFYNALIANIEILNTVQPPVSEKNEFLHYIFETLQNVTVDEINKSGLPDSAKQSLSREIPNLHAFFAFYDVNNVSLILESKRRYEREYHRLRASLSSDDLKKDEANAIVRLGAIDAAMHVFQKYTEEYDIHFLFQAIVANAANDAFHYLKNNHITVITRNDPHQVEKSLADTVFVTMHEILHQVYPYAHATIGFKHMNSVSDCVEENVQWIGETDAVKPDEGWFNGDILNEDIVNVIAMRVVMKMAANVSVNEEQLKEALETVIGGLCKQSKRKNEHIPYHHPLEISLNTAVRQYPLFSSLYGCRDGDRMFTKPGSFCKPLNNTVIAEDYEVKSNRVDKDVGGFFKSLINTSKSLNFTYGVL